MPQGKPAGVRCIHLTPENLCRLFGRLNRPKVCEDFAYDPEICGERDGEAILNLIRLEQLTKGDD